MRKIWPIALIVFIGVVCRFFPHPANFTPVAALAIFGGLYMPKRYAIFIPLAIMAVSDFFIGFYSWPIMASVYLSFALAGLLGIFLRNHKSALKVLGGAVFGSALFFLITNAAVCFFGAMYAHSWAGLMQSYIAAVPFFRNSLAGDIFYVIVLVGGYEMLTNWVANRSNVPEHI